MQDSNKFPDTGQPRPEVCRLITQLMGDGAVTRDTTLADLRSTMMDSRTILWDGVELLHAQDRTSFVILLDELIAERGADAPAADFH